MATEIRVPTLGESVTEATIGRWFKKAGEAVAVDGGHAQRHWKHGDAHSGLLGTPAAAFADLLGQRLAQARPIDRVDGVEQRHRLALAELLRGRDDRRVGEGQRMHRVLPLAGQAQGRATRREHVGPTH